MLKAADSVAMRQEDSASRNGEMTSWDINDIKLPQVCVCILEIYPNLISLLHYKTLFYASSHLCSLSPWAIGHCFAWRAREYPVKWSSPPSVVFWSPYLKTLTMSSTENPWHPALFLTLVRMCQIPPARLLYHSAPSFTFQPSSLIWSQSLLCYVTAAFPKFPCPRPPPPQGHLHLHSAWRLPP